MKEIILSIFVPCFNEENYITNTLNNIKEGIQTISYEILVADDASTDKTIEMIEKFKKSNPNINIKIFRNKKNRGLGYNFWATAHKALGKYYFILMQYSGLSLFCIFCYKAYKKIIPLELMKHFVDQIHSVLF